MLGQSCQKCVHKSKPNQHVLYPILSCPVTPLTFIYLEKARQSFFSQTVEAKNMADF